MKDKNHNSSTNPLTGVADEISNLSKDPLTQADEILFHTQKFLYYNNLMVEQCSRWLSEREKSSE
jgi:hypothetical protein